MLCTAPQCERPTEKNRKLCSTHRKRVRRSIPLDQPVRPYIRGLEARLLGWSHSEGNHRIWHGTGYRNGYGKIKINGRSRLVHRVAYELWVGPIPPGYEVDHRCFIRRCISPACLEAITQAENLRRQNMSRNPVTGQYLSKHLIHTPVST